MQRHPVSVVVLVSEERPESLETCLQALHPTLWVHDETLIVAPGEPSAASAADLQFPWARTVQAPATATAADAVNRAVAEARHDTVVLLRSDVVVVPDWLTRLVAPMRDAVVAAAAPRSDGATVVEPVLLGESAPTSFHELVASSLDWHWQHIGQRTDRAALDEFCFALRVEAWRSVAGFDATTDRPGTDLSAFWARLLEAGWSLVSADDTFVHLAAAGSAFADPTGRWNFRLAHDERQMRRTQELGGSVAFDRDELRSQYAGARLPYPPAIAPAASAHAGGHRPRISVIVPTQNRHMLLRRALESVLEQTVHAQGVAIEVLVVNDGGVDVRPVAAEFADRLDVRVLDLSVSRGRAAACNRGLTAARGELVSFLDDDDIFFPHHLSTVLAAFDRDPSPRTIAHSYAVATTLSEEKGMLLRGVVGDQPFNGEALSVGNMIAGLSVLAPTELLRSEGGFDERLPMFDDWELWLRLTRIGVRVLEVAMPTAEMFRHQRRVGSKELRRTHDALLHVYRQHPVAANSAADKGRLTRVGESMSGAQTYPLDVSVVVSGGHDLGAVVRTLKTAGVAMTGGRWELLLVVPDVRAYQVLLDQLEGDFRAFSVGEMPTDDALAYGTSRAGGRHVLLLEAGEALDHDALLEVFASPSAQAVRVGRREFAAV